MSFEMSSAVRGATGCRLCFPWAVRSGAELGMEHSAQGCSVPWGARGASEGSHGTWGWLEAQGHGLC